MDLKAELLAELDRLETLARHPDVQYTLPWRQGNVRGPGYDCELIYTHPDESGFIQADPEGVAAHIASHDPSATLRRIAGIRAVVELHETTGDRDHLCGQCRDVLGDCETWPCPTILALHEGFCGGYR